MAESRTHAWTDGPALVEWTGLLCLVLVFLIGPAVPQLLQGSQRSAQLEVLTENPVLFRDRAAYALQIQNNGRTTRHAVEVWVPLPPGGEAVIEPGPYDSSPATLLDMGERDRHRVFGMGDLDAGASRTLSVRVNWPSADGAEARPSYPPWVIANVVSAEGRGQQTGWRLRAYRSESSERWYRNAFALMAAAVVVLAVLVLRPRPRPAPKPAPAPKEAWRRPAALALPH